MCAHIIIIIEVKTTHECNKTLCAFPFFAYLPRAMIILARSDNDDGTDEISLLRSLAFQLAQSQKGTQRKLCVCLQKIVWVFDLH